MNSFKQNLKYISLVCLAVVFTQCKTKSEKATANSEQSEIQENTEALHISTSEFGKLPSGEKITKYQLTNKHGMEVAIINYGGVITNLKVPDKNGAIEDVVLGFDSLEDYLIPPPYFGAIIGRYGNRIAGGKFAIDGEEYTLAQNDGKNHLHGGNKGFDKVVWEVKPIQEKDYLALQLSYTSKDMEEGYPGNLKTIVTYTLDNTNTLKVAYEATTDKKTVVNLTQHSYFNLSGDFSKTILDHQIMINADAFLPVDSSLIPTGEFKDVAGTPFDFRSSKVIGKEINTENEQLERGLGYDHCWVLNNQNNGQQLAATAYDPESGRIMEVFTDEPGIQFYTGNFLDGTLSAKGGGTYAKRTGFCLETQHYPDSPNQKEFPSVELKPGETYKTETSFKFSTK